VAVAAAAAAAAAALHSASSHHNNPGMVLDLSQVSSCAALCLRIYPATTQVSLPVRPCVVVVANRSIPFARSFRHLLTRARTINPTTSLFFFQHNFYYFHSLFLA
jgi:hypothetical protein